MPFYGSGFVESDVSLKVFHLCRRLWPGSLQRWVGRPGRSALPDACYNMDKLLKVTTL